MASGRPRSYSVDGIVLRRRNLGEADSIFTVFSIQQGKFDAVARGVRKPRSKMRGHLEPLTRAQMQLAQGRTLDVFTQAEMTAAHRVLKEDFDLLATAIYCCELVDRFTADRVPQRPIFDLLVDVLEALDAGASASLARYFEVHLLSMTGYALQLDGCAHCGAHLPEEDALLSPAAGGLLCRQCRPLGAAGRIVDARAIKVLRFARRASVAEFNALRLDDELAASLQRALGDVIHAILDREPNSARYLEGLRPRGPA